MYQEVAFGEIVIFLFPFFFSIDNIREQQASRGRRFVLVSGYSWINGVIVKCSVTQHLAILSSALPRPIILFESIETSSLLRSLNTGGLAPFSLTLQLKSYRSVDACDTWFVRAFERDIKNTGLEELCWINRGRTSEGKKKKKGERKGEKYEDKRELNFGSEI